MVDGCGDVRRVQGIARWGSMEKGTSWGTPITLTSGQLPSFDGDSKNHQNHLG
jgi:hypothetical protein